jgi:NAD(P)-binding Rossmann-like domain
MDMRKVTVIGGGLGGLVAAITAAEAGAEVTLHEAHRTLGGRWRTARQPYLAHEGPHVIYRDGPLWAWLAERQLLGQTCRVGLGATLRFRFRLEGQIKRNPPVALARALLLGVRRNVPSEDSYSEWISARLGEHVARIAASAAGVAVFHPDPGALSAAFVAERLGRVFSLPPKASYRRGSWGATLFDDLATYAISRGVTIELRSRVSQVGDGITIIATELESARRLLGDDTLDWPSGRTALLDLGVVRGRSDAFVLSDLDHCGWLETFSYPDPTIAPAGEHLAQISAPIGHEESKAVGVARAEGLADLALPGWRERTTYRLEAVANARTGAVDYPGATWRDRPAVDRGDGVYLVGDRVAAPGLLSEVSFNSAVIAGTLAAGFADHAVCDQAFVGNSGA